MKTPTREKLIEMIQERLKKYGPGNELYYRSLYNLWIKYNWDQECCELLESAKRWRE